MAEYKINDNFGFQGEVLYSPLGGKEKIDGVNPTNFVMLTNRLTILY
jgi:hypothetical protein